MQRSSPTSARNDYDATQPAVRRIDVAEISSRIDRNISRNDYDIHEFTKHATRTAKNVQVIRVSFLISLLLIIPIPIIRVYRVPITYRCGIPMQVMWRKSEKSGKKRVANENMDVSIFQGILK